MAIIDQRILIPARQDVVWAYLSDLSRNAEWQADCKSVSFLSTRHEGAGTRWRVSADKTKDAVYEITSWYNGLGYEYVIVDGAAYKDNKGRLRLQEIAEGTVVQWTFSFEGGGLLGGGKVRQLDATMAASLKALYKQVKALSQSEGLVARSLMRDAPDVEARAAYKPRHPTSLADGSPAEVAEDAVLLPPTPEPAVQVEDAAFVAAVDLSAEPPLEVDDTRPRPAVEAAPDENLQFAPPPAPEPTGEARDPSPDVPAPAAPLAAAMESVAAEPPVQPDAVIPDRTAAAVAAAAAASQLPPPDPAGKSIWEVFGVQPPVVAAVTSAEVRVDDAPAEESPSAAAGEAAPEPVSEPPRTPDPQETVPLEAVVVPTAVVIPPVVVETIAGVETDDAVDPADVGALGPAGAQLVRAPDVLPSRRGLRIVERRGLVKLRRPF